MAILERETSVQIGEGLTWASCAAVIFATETTSGEILVTFWPKVASCYLRMPNFNMPDPPYLIYTYAPISVINMPHLLPPE